MSGSAARIEQGGPLGPPCAACGMFEGSVTPGHLCVPPQPEDGWSVVRVGEDGLLAVLCTLTRFDLAERRADDLAHSIARNDAARVAAGRECSGTRALIVGWDVWEIRHADPCPVVHAIPASVPRPRIVAEALSTLGV